MLNALLSDWFHLLGRRPCFRIYGKGRRETAWRVIAVYATRRRNLEDGWPLLWKGTCTTWSAEVISIGWDFAREVVWEQAARPASRQHPVTVAGGRIDDLLRRASAGVPDFATPAEVLAHQIGHTWQALRIGPAYLPLVGALTLFQEGPHPWNRFENEASEQGQFGGLVNGSVCPELSSCLR